MLKEATTTEFAIPLNEFMQHRDEGRSEFIRGEWIEKMGTLAVHTLILKKIFLALLELERVGAGLAFMESTFILEARRNWVSGSRIPDAMFYTSERAAQIKARPDWQRYPLTVVPNLVIEIISPSDLYESVVNKAHQDRANGVDMVWLVSSDSKRIAIFDAGSDGTRYVEGDVVLSGAPVLPGLSLALNELFQL